MLSILSNRDPGSIRSKIQWLLIPLLIAAWLVAIIAIYLSARFEISDVLDEQTNLLAIATANATGDGIIELDQDDFRRSFRHYKGDFLLRIRDSQGVLIFDSQPNEPQFPSLEPGPNDVRTLRDDWLVTRYDLTSGAELLIGQREHEVNEVIWQMVWSAIVPLTFVFIASVAAIFFAVRTGLQPLTHLSSDLQRRSAAQLDALGIQGQPKELTPIIRALNGLFERINDVMVRERQFIDDAAHELRTPLAAIKAQCQIIDRNALDPDARKRFDNILKGVDRAASLSNSLLDQARADQASAKKTDIDIAASVRRTMADLLPVAEGAGITMELVASSSARMHCSEEDLSTILNNIIMNAIKNCAPNGHIQISQTTDSIVIEDDGPGIPEAMRQKVFERFVRVEGNQSQGAGLGLSVVRSLARRNNLDIAITTSQALGGACLEIKRS